MDKQEVAKLEGSFYMDSEGYCYIITEKENFVWRCPYKDSEGRWDHRLSRTNRSLSDWKSDADGNNINYLGKHIIGDFCGEFDYNPYGYSTC